jgi:hypothetical protein
MEPRPAEPRHIAPWERDRQRRAAAQTPRPLRGRDRVPGEGLAHPAAPAFAVPPPAPWLPQLATPPPTAPGVRLLAARWRFCDATGGGPPLERPPPIARDAPHCNPARPGCQPAHRLRARFQRLLAPPAPVRPVPRDRAAPNRAPPRAIPRPLSCLDPQLQAPLREPRHTGQHPLPCADALPVDGAVLRVAGEPGAPLLQLRIRTVP